MANKNSIYVQSLVSFINDTKPYHSKLTEIVEEYRFSDQMNVKIVDNVFSSLTTKSAWAYSHFADGVSVPAPLTKIHEVVSPLFRGTTSNSEPSDNRGQYKVGRDESSLIPLVPFAFDPTALEGAGLADAAVQRNGNVRNTEPLLEGHDVFLSHGAYVFRVSQTTRVGTDEVYDPLFAELRNEDVIKTAKQTTAALLTDTSNPNSSISQIHRILNEVRSSAESDPAFAPVVSELDKLQIILDLKKLPRSYDDFFTVVKDTKKLDLDNSPKGVSLPAGFLSWDAVESLFEELSPTIYFDYYNDIGTPNETNTYNDSRLREGGALRYNEITDRDDVQITNIVVNHERENYDEITIHGISKTEFMVYGSHSGLIGSGAFPAFSSAGISFKIKPAFIKEYGTDETFPLTETLPFEDASLYIAGPAIQTSSDTIEVTGPGVVQVGASIVGKKITLTPAAKITVHEKAPLEVWSLIKVNPLAYSRPRFRSTRYGYITSGSGERDTVTILDTAFPTGTLVLTCVGNGRFTVTSTGESNYLAVAEVDKPFNDGRVAFTIVDGTAYQFAEGDKFFVEILNELPKATGLDLYYGYDMDPYDGGSTYVYDAVNNYLQSLDFNFDSRFVAYDTSSFNLQVSPSTAARSWRLRALPNMAKPLPQRPPADNRVDQTQAQEPDQNLSPLFDRDGNAVPDIRLYYADEFALEYFGADGTWKFVSTVPVGATYSSAQHGISFTLVEATKPFISAVVTESNGAEYRGGDVIAWDVENNPPAQTEPASLSSVRTPRLIIHGDSFYDTVDATWTLEWQSQGVYTLQGVYNSGEMTNANVFSEPKTINLSNGLSFKDAENSLHWTIVLGNIGLAYGDVFTFSTHSAKPSFLVHGSVSGWQKPASFGEYYWNGKVGFKINKPISSVFQFGRYIQNSVTGLKEWAPLPEGYVASLGEDPGIWVQADSSVDGFYNISVTYLRDDADGGVYRLKSHADGHWTLYKDGKAVDTGTDSVGDKYIRLSVPADVTKGAVAHVKIVADERDVFTGYDLAIVKSTAGRMPTTSDFVVFKRARYDDIQISVQVKDQKHAVALADLGQSAIDPRFIDPNISIVQNTSQETTVLTGWIPSLLTVYDGTNSLAEFSDIGVSLVVRAAATGQTIGTVLSMGNTPSEPVYFRWNSDFAAKYLPLNTEATIVTYSSGMNDLVKVNMSESAVFLLSGGGLSSSSLFKEHINLGVSESLNWDIRLGRYDAVKSGDLALTKMLAAKTRTPEEESQYAALLGKIRPYLENGSLSETGQIWFDTALLSNPSSSPYDFSWTDESVTAEVKDTGFTGFLPGYDNLAYDKEDGADGYYDAGYPLLGHFDEAKFLKQKENNGDVLTDVEKARLDSYKVLIGAVVDDPTTMTVEEFVDAISAANPLRPIIDNPVNVTPTLTGFGIPDVGLGIQINEHLPIKNHKDRQKTPEEIAAEDRETTKTQVVDSMILTSVEFGFAFDRAGYGVGELDAAPDTTVVIIPGSTPPIPSTGIPPAGTAYSDFESGTTVNSTGRIIEVSFANTVSGTPQFYIWRADDTVPRLVSVVEKLSNRLYRFYLAKPVEFKLIVT